jgi:hypothetical protein
MGTRSPDLGEMLPEVWRPRSHTSTWLYKTTLVRAISEKRSEKVCKARSPYNFKKSYGGTPEPRTMYRTGVYRNLNLKIQFRGFPSHNFSQKEWPHAGGVGLKWSRKTSLAILYNLRYESASKPKERERERKLWQFWCPDDTMSAVTRITGLGNFGDFRSRNG